MIVAWEPLLDSEPWHLAEGGDQVALCGGPLIGFIRPRLALDDLGGDPCAACWREARLIEGAYAAESDQEAERLKHEGA